MKERYGISGSHGFLGSRLKELLKGHSVASIGRSGKAGRYDRIFDLAGYGNHREQQDVGKIYKANVTRLIRMLETAKDYKSFIVCSTSSIQLPYQTHYSQSKRAAELLAQQWVKETGDPVMIVRPFSVYGPGERKDRFIPTIIRCAREGETLKLGEGVHDWIYIDDFLKGMITVAEQGTPGEIYNIGTGVQTSNEDVVATVESYLGKINIKPVGKLKEYDTNDWVANNDKIRALGWTPRISLHEGIGLCVKEF